MTDPGSMQPFGMLLGLALFVVVARYLRLGEPRPVVMRRATTDTPPVEVVWGDPSVVVTWEDPPPRPVQPEPPRAEAALSPSRKPEQIKGGWGELVGRRIEAVMTTRHLAENNSKFDKVFLCLDDDTHYEVFSGDWSGLAGTNHVHSGGLQLLLKSREVGEGMWVYGGELDGERPNP